MNLELTDSLTTNYTLDNISEKCTQLQELIFGGSNCSFTEIGKITFSYMLKIQMFKVAYVFAAFRNFIPKMKYLTFLNLKGLANITDQSISGLADLEHLKYLNLKRCTGITDDCGKTLRNTKLERLDMSYTLVFFFVRYRW